MTSYPATYNIYRTPTGPLTIAAAQRGISAIYYGEKKLDLDFGPTSLTNQAANELIEYFAMKRRFFTIPIDIDMTSFEKDVIDTIKAIPYGSELATKEVAAQMNNPNAYRHIGKVIQAFDLAPLVPFHRIAQKGRYDKRAQIYGAMLKMEQLAISQSCTSN